MSNDCTGVMRVVSKNKETIERIVKILNYEDSEYALYRCKYAQKLGVMEEDGDFFVQDIEISGAWTCDQFFFYGDNPNDKVLEDVVDGKKVYGTAHFTDLCHLATVLDFGCELFSEEWGCGFCDHFELNHNGEIQHENGDFEANYPEDENGEPNYDAEPDLCYGIDGYGEYCDNDCIYG